jgi:hypothetical protein
LIVEIFLSCVISWECVDVLICFIAQVHISLISQNRGLTRDL